MRKCSTTGPRVSTGRKFRAPTNNIVPSNSMMNVPPDTGKVPVLAGTSFFCASDPAMAMMGTIIRKRPKSMAMPRVVLYQGVLALRPAKALPLLPTADE